MIPQETTVRRLTEREMIYDTVRAACRGEFPARNAATGRCAYETPEGRRCIIGRFLPDGHPGLKFEGPVVVDDPTLVPTLVVSLLEKYPDLKSRFPENPSFLINLQSVHDGLVISQCVNEMRRFTLAKFLDRMRWLFGDFEDVINQAVEDSIERAE